MNMYKSSSLNSHGKPDILFCLKYHSKSFRKIANKKGDRFSPWRTPILQGKKADTPSSVLSLILYFYISFVIILSIYHLYSMYSIFAINLRAKQYRRPV